MVDGDMGPTLVAQRPLQMRNLSAVMLVVLPTEKETGSYLLLDELSGHNDIFNHHVFAQSGY